jgi:hypothetical protein
LASDLFLTGNVSGDIDLRQEFINLIESDGYFAGLKQKVLLRRNNRDANGKLVPCDCIDPVTKEADTERLCEICHSDFYKWAEEWIYVYKIKNGTSYTFYMRYDTDPKVFDKIIEMSVDINGNVVTPYVRTAKFNLTDIYPMKANVGRVEYFKCIAYKVDPPSTGTKI